MFRMYLTKEISLSKKSLNNRSYSDTVGNRTSRERWLIAERRQDLNNRYSFTFEEGVEKLKGFIRFHSYRFGQISRLNDKEDFESIAHSVIWKGIAKYKPQCPVCLKKFKSFAGYKRHSHNGGRIIKPRFSLDSYIKLRILSAFQTEIKKEVAQKRLPEGGIAVLESEPPHINRGFGSADMRDVIQVMLREFTSVEKAIVQMLCDRYAVTDIIILLEPHGIKVSKVRQTIHKFRDYLTSNYYFNKKSKRTA